MSTIKETTIRDGGVIINIQRDEFGAGITVWRASEWDRGSTQMQMPPSERPAASLSFYLSGEKLDRHIEGLKYER